MAKSKSKTKVKSKKVLKAKGPVKKAKRSKSSSSVSTREMAIEGLKIAGQVAQTMGKKLKKPKLRKFGRIAERVSDAISESQSKSA